MLYGVRKSGEDSGAGGKCVSGSVGELLGHLPSTHTHVYAFLHMLYLIP